MSAGTSPWGACLGLEFDPDYDTTSATLARIADSASKSRPTAHAGHFGVVGGNQASNLAAHQLSCAESDGRADRVDDPLTWGQDGQRGHRVVPPKQFDAAGRHPTKWNDRSGNPIVHQVGRVFHLV